MGVDKTLRESWELVPFERGRNNEEEERRAHLVNTGIDRDVCELDVTRQVHDGNYKYTLCAEPPSVSLLCVYVTAIVHACECVFREMGKRDDAERLIYCSCLFYF